MNDSDSSIEFLGTIPPLIRNLSIIRGGIVPNGFWTPKFSACGGLKNLFFELFSTFENYDFSSPKFLSVIRGYSPEEFYS